jgi:hypothetical protein
MAHLVWGICCAALLFQIWRLSKANSELLLKTTDLRYQSQMLIKQIEEAVRKLDAEDASGRPVNRGLPAVVEELTALGVPGLVLLVAISSLDFADTAGLSSLSACLGGEFRRLGNITALITLSRASKAVARYGLPSISDQVLKRLITTGKSISQIRKEVAAIPSWILNAELRITMEEILGGNEVCTAA